MSPLTQLHKMRHKDRAYIEPILSIHVAQGLRAWAWFWIVFCVSTTIDHHHHHYYHQPHHRNFSTTSCSNGWKVHGCVHPEVSAKVLQPMLSFWQYFKSEAGQLKTMLSVRDLLAWAAFINLSAQNIGPMGAFFHGVELVLLDGIGLSTGMSLEVCTFS